jgi:hypothetical protein
MDIRLIRGSKTKDGIFGTMYDTNDNIVAVTLEHAFPSADKLSWQPKTALGAYKCVRYDSPGHGYEVFTLENVPPFMGSKVTFIEIHVGNYNADSDGCILVGSEKNGNMIMDSKITFDKFMTLQKDVDNFTLTISEEV